MEGHAAEARAGIPRLLERHVGPQRAHHLRRADPRGDRPPALAYAIQLDRLIDLSRLDPAHGNVAVALLLNECAELIRFPLVVATVPAVTRWWERVRPDWFKPKMGAGEEKEVLRACLYGSVASVLGKKDDNTNFLPTHLPTYNLCPATADGQLVPTMADKMRRHGPVFMVYWGALWVGGAAGLFGVRGGWGGVGREEGEPRAAGD